MEPGHVCTSQRQVCGKVVAHARGDIAEHNGNNLVKVI